MISEFRELLSKERILTIISIRRSATSGRATRIIIMASANESAPENALNICLIIRAPGD